MYLYDPSTYKVMEWRDVARAALEDHEEDHQSTVTEVAGKIAEQSVSILTDPGVIDDFTTHGWSHIYGLPYPSTESLDPMELYYTLMFQVHPQKTLIYFFTQLLNPYSRVHATFDLKPMYIEMCA